jgi:hypothetical protein
MEDVDLGGTIQKAAPARVVGGRHQASRPVGREVEIVQRRDERDVAGECQSEEPNLFGQLGVYEE